MPFGGVIDENNKLTWRESERVMSLDGFNSADAHGELRDVAGVRLRVANLPGLVALNLFAFRDRGADPRSSDLGDLNYIFSNASDALRERVYQGYRKVGTSVSERSRRPPFRKRSSLS